MIRRIVAASILTAVIWIWFQYEFPADSLSVNATAVVFAIMFGLVYMIERLSPVARRGLSGVVSTSRRLLFGRPNGSNE